MNEITEIVNNFERLCETDPLLALAMVAIGLVVIGCAAIGLKV